MSHYGEYVDLTDRFIRERVMSHTKLCETLKLSERLQQYHDSGDLGLALEGLPEQALAVEQQRDDLQAKYNDLIMQVEAKVPCESRHDTAKRYIASYELARQAIAKAKGAV